MLLVALVLFVGSTVWSAFLRSWPLALLAAGMVFLILAGHPTLSLHVE